MLMEQFMKSQKITNYVLYKKFYLFIRHTMTSSGEKYDDLKKPYD